jgi:hypothetical protein
VQLLRSLNQFFDRALYFVSIAYQEAGKKLILENIDEFGRLHQPNHAHPHRRAADWLP